MIRNAFGVLFLGLCFWLAAPAGAHAACLACSCSINAGDVAFGNFQPLDNASKDSSGDIVVSCGPVGLLVSYDITLSTGGSGAFATRRMSGGGYTLDYNLYTTSGRTTVWGDGTSSTGVVSDAWLISVGHVSQTHKIWARLHATTTAQPGAYTDTLVARIAW